MTKEAIVRAASQMKTTHDLLVLLNRIKMDELGDKGHPFTMPQLNFFINPKRTASRYRTFTIPKKSGGERIISAPVRLLKSFQTYMNRILQAFYEAPDCVTGFVPAKSVVDNAERHVGQVYVFNTDLKDFFPSISQARVWGALKTRPFCFEKTIASAIAGLCSIQVEDGDGSGDAEDGQETDKKKYRYVLPQGSPCSPVLTNIVCHNLDWKLQGLARRFNLRYSRYADDITFSSAHNVYQEDGEFMTELRRIVTEQRFTINEKKTRLQKRGSRQEVTGLVVSDRVNVTREYVRDLDNLLYIWERHGVNAAFAKFMTRYVPKQNIMLKTPDMTNVIGGKLMYLKMVKGDDSPVWRRLQKRFNRLTERDSSAGGTDIVYKYVYPIDAFEQRFRTSLVLTDGEGPLRLPYFILNGQRCFVSLSKYARTRLGSVVAGGEPKQMEQFRERFRIAYCHRDGDPEDSFFWLVIRKLPGKAAVDLSGLEELDEDLLEELGFPVEEEPSPIPGGLSTAEMIDTLVDSGFDLNTLDKWDKTRNRS